MKSALEALIIGAGAAGIAAARRLTDAGVDCLLVEARDRLGGRAWTTEAGGYAVDLGCGWLHSDRNPWVAIAEREGCTVDRTPPPWERPSRQPGFPLPEQRAFREALGAFYERVGELPEAAPDRPLSAFLDEGGRWNPLLDAISTYFSGAELAKVSAEDLNAYADSEVNWRVVEGYGLAIVRHAAGLEVALGCTVETIDHSGPRLSVGTTKGAITADAVIVTLPSALVAEERIRFTPALPEKAEAAAGLPLGLADKLFLALETPEEFEPDSRLFGRTDRAGTGAYHVRPFGRPMIEVFFGGDCAEALERGGEAAFADFAREELVGLFGADFARRIRPLALHGWRTDPFAFGSYSYARPGRTGDRTALAAPVDSRLFFAGEACSAEDFSTAHGAYRTGIAAAGDAIAALRGTG